MDNTLQNGFVLSGWRVSPAEGLLCRNKDTVHLEPKVMDVLVYFARHPGEVISREDLERDVWRGAVVGYDAVTATVIKLRKALKDDARNAQIIATIPKKGYQLIAPVVAEAATSDVPASSRKPSVQKRRWLGWAAAALVAIVTVVGLTYYNTTPISTDIPSILVLPIEDRDAGRQHQNFIVGMTEDMITDLSRLSNIQVFANNTSFKYQYQEITPQQLHQELNVDYVLKGTFRRQGEQLRMNIYLVDARSGFNTWAQRYDAKINDVFSLQDKITRGLIDVLRIRLSAQEKQLLAKRATNNLSAYEYFLEGQALSKHFTRLSHAQARDAYLQAIETDPAYGRAYGALAYIMASEYRRGWTDAPVESLERALAMAEQGVNLDNSIPQTYWSLGYVYLMRKEHDLAEKAVEKAIAIAPNYADGYGLLALITNNLGEPDKALAYAIRGMKLNPYYTWDYLYNKGRALYALGRYEEAIDALELGEERNENAIPIKLFLAASYVRADRLEDAEWTVEQIRVINPVTTLSHTDKTLPTHDADFKARLLDDLREAGLPD